MPSTQIARGIRIAIGVLVASASYGCAVHYYDAQTGADHVLGFGYMVMKVSAPKTNHPALASGNSVALFGLSVCAKGPDTGVSIGYNHTSRILAYADEPGIVLSWPSSTFWDVRIGPPFPLSTNLIK